jgi:alpha-galactosidase
MNNRYCYRTLLYCVSLVCIVSATAGAQMAGTLKTAETRLRFEAGPHSPKMTALQNGTEVLTNRMTEAPISEVEIGGDTRWIEWNLNVAESHADQQIVSFVYDSPGPRLRLTWQWEVRSQHGPIEHQIRIENRDAREVWIPLQTSFPFDWETQTSDQLEQFYVEKGADTPSEIGTHVVPVPVGYKWQGTSSTYAQKRPGEEREIIPYLLVEHPLGVQSGWYVGVEFSGRTHITLARKGDSLRGEVGLNPDLGQFRTRLKPGEVFETPRIFLGANTGGPDAASNVLRRWVREVLTNQEAWKDPHYPLTVNDSWGGGMVVDEEIANHMIHDSAALGLEMFHLDAGWFRGVGDWQPDREKFPHGLQPIADRAHAQGLKFGLWADWTQAGVDNAPGALNARDSKTRGWLTTDLPVSWKPEEFKGQPVDIGDPPAKTWAMRETDRIVSDYKLDMLEHDGYLVAQGCDASDHPHAPPDPLNKCTYRDAGFVFERSSNSTDVSYHAVRAYYDIQANLRKKHPGLLLEICNDGGRMVDFGSASHGDYFSITDTYDPLSNRRAFYDASFVLPTAMLEAYVESWPEGAKNPSIENFRYMLRSGMMGWLSIMIDTTQWDADHHKVAKEEIDLYKSHLRQLIRDADLYHISQRPDGVNWDGVEYFDPKTERGALYAFRGSTPTEARHRFVLRGVDAASRYRISFHDHSSADTIIDGDKLLTSGLIVQLPISNSSEIIFLEAMPEQLKSSHR